MAINFNPASLVGLNRGGRAPVDYSGRDLLVEAIAESLAEEGQTDDEIRHYLCKVDDFEVTQAVRDEVLRRRALVVYNAIFSGIRRAVEDGETVSINGFARFFVSEPDDLVEVGVIVGGDTLEPVFPESVITYENRTAALVEGCWQGGAVPDEHDSGEIYPQGSIYEPGPGGGVANIPIARESMIVSGDAYELKNRAVVTAATEDGEIRQYEVGGLSINLAVRKYLETRWNGQGGADEYGVYSQLGGQRALVWGAQGFAGDAEQIAKELGRSVAMSVSDWDLVKDRRVSVLSSAEVAREAFGGIPAHHILSAYPRRVKIMRRDYAMYEVRKIEPALFEATFLHRRDELIAAGVWPGRSRNMGAAVRAEFRAAFVEGVQ